MYGEERKNPSDYTGWGYVFLIDGLVKRVNEFLIIAEYEAAYNSLESLYSETIHIILKKVVADDKETKDDKTIDFDKKIDLLIEGSKRNITRSDIVNLSRIRNTLRTSRIRDQKFIIKLRDYHLLMSTLTHKADLRLKDFKRTTEPITSG